MAGTFSQIYIQIVFAVQNRAALISPDWEEQLFKYITGIVQNKGQKMLAIGGIEDHMHLLVGLKSSHRLDYFLRELKAGSSGWTRREQIPEFSWQPGYGAFTVSPGNLEIASRYIRNQREHHQSKDFKAEYLEMLRSGRIDFDEQYLW